jgi:hypothetical protein
VAIERRQADCPDREHGDGRDAHRRTADHLPDAFRALVRPGLGTGAMSRAIPRRNSPGKEVSPTLYAPKVNLPPSPSTRCKRVEWPYLWLNVTYLDANLPQGPRRRPARLRTAIIGFAVTTEGRREIVGLGTRRARPVQK